MSKIKVAGSHITEDGNQCYSKDKIKFKRNLYRQKKEKNRKKNTAIIINGCIGIGYAPCPDQGVVSPHLSEFFKVGYFLQDVPVVKTKIICINGVARKPLSYG